MNWQVVRGLTGGSFVVSVLNVFVVNMTPLLWAWFAVSGSLFFVSSYKIRKRGGV